MRIAIASGKGGTGKTTVATNIAAALAESGQHVAYLDCDVEEPNGHIFLKPDIERSQQVSIPMPRVELEKCTGCGECGQFCSFSAIVSVKGKVLTFPELCHGCGGCSLVCPEEAIEEVPRPIGVCETGSASGMFFAHGRLKIGEAMSPPLIKKVKVCAPADSVIIIDAPPGASCPTVEAVRGADFVLLVAESTPFGLHDLKIAVELVQQLGLPMAVAVNRTGLGNGLVEKYCQQLGIELLLNIPYDRRIAEAYSRGQLIIEELPEYSDQFLGLFRRMQEEAKR